MNEWVPFHESLRRGDKRGLPRAVRFIYLELSLEARPFGGRIPLARGFKSDLDAVHDLLGGKRSEIALALTVLGAPLDPTDPSERPMIEVSGPTERRVLTVVAHETYVKRDLSTPRTRKHREKQTEQYPAPTEPGNAFRTNATSAPGTLHMRGEERRGEKKRSPIAPVGGGTGGTVPESAEPPKKSPGYPEQAFQLWLDAWHIRTGKPKRGSLMPDERKRATELHRAKVPLERIRLAALGIHDSPFHTGENDRGAKFMRFFHALSSSAFDELVERGEAFEVRRSQPPLKRAAAPEEHPATPEELLALKPRLEEAARLLKAQNREADLLMLSVPAGAP